MALTKMMTLQAELTRFKAVGVTVIRIGGPMVKFNHRLILFLAISSVGHIAFGAQELVVTTLQSPFNLNIANQGWWSTLFAQSGGVQKLYTDNYLTGLNVNGATYRGFFSFDLRNLTEHVRSARFEVRLGTSASPDLTERLGLFQIDTPVEILNSKPGVLRLDIFDDLGTGDLYGEIDVPIGASTDMSLNILLNQQGIDAINSHLGTFFSLGTSLVDIDPMAGEQFVFGYSSSDRGYVAKLVLILVPEPQSLAMFYPILMLSCLCRKWNVE